MERLVAALKIFVVAGGVVLVLGTALLIVLLVQRTGERAPLVGEHHLTLPAGMRVVQLVPEGERLLLLLEDEAGNQAIAIVDRATGERRALIRLEAVE